jgi:hypothetical protein
MYGRSARNARWMRIGPAYSIMKTVVHEACGPVPISWGYLEPEVHRAYQDL